MPRTRGVMCFIKFIVEYIVEEVLHAPGLGGLNIFMKFIVYCRIHCGGGASCLGLGELCFL